MSALLLAWLLSNLAVVDTVADDLEDHRKAFQSKLLDIDGAAQTELKTLRGNYVEALSRLEKTHQEARDLRGMHAIQKEKEQVEAGDEPEGAEVPDELLAMREVFRDSKAKIDGDRLAKRSEVTGIYKNLLEQNLSALTQAGKLEEALAVREEIEQLSENPQVREEPEAPAEENGIVSLFAFPEERPPVVADPFAETRWKESMTVPPGEYRLRNAIGIGEHGKGTRIFLSSGGNYTRQEGKFHVWGGRLYGEDCRFKDIPFRADHSGGMSFRNCRFNDCNIREEGTWYGNGNYDSKWYFENCRVEGSLHNGGFNVHYLGLCMTRCTLERIELPSIWYRKSEPVARRKDKWLTIDKCVFEKCKVPMSFLLVTTDCVFIDCRFEDDTSQNEIKEPIEVIYYASDCTNAIREAPDAVTMTERPLADLKIPVGSILPTE